MSFVDLQQKVDPFFICPWIQYVSCCYSIRYVCAMSAIWTMHVCIHYIRVYSINTSYLTHYVLLYQFTSLFIFHSLALDSLSLSSPLFLSLSRSWDLWHSVIEKSTYTYMQYSYSCISTIAIVVFILGSYSMNENVRRRIDFEKNEFLLFVFFSRAYFPFITFHNYSSFFLFLSLSFSSFFLFFLSLLALCFHSCSSFSPSLLYFSSLSRCEKLTGFFFVFFSEMRQKEREEARKKERRKKMEQKCSVWECVSRSKCRWIQKWIFWRFDSLSLQDQSIVKSTIKFWEKWCLSWLSFFSKLTDRLKYHWLTIWKDGADDEEQMTSAIRETRSFPVWKMFSSLA